MAFGILTAASQRRPLLPIANSVNVPEVALPTQLKARTLITLPPVSVSKVITTSPWVRFGTAGHAGLGSLDWLNS